MPSEDSERWSAHLINMYPTFTAEQVKEHARANLTGYKHTSIVEFRK
ncbi:MAG: hypothetical protein ABW278_04120 [Steroidobacteraceae bacterium]